MKKKFGGTTLPGGRVSRLSQRVGVDATFFSFKKALIRHVCELVKTKSLTKQFQNLRHVCMWLNIETLDILTKGSKHP